MQYTKPIVDLVYEIRRRVDAPMKPSVKMANPDVLKELADYHQHSKDTITKALIKELLYMAGPEWAVLLEPPANNETKEIQRQVVKVYRGQTILAPASESKPHNNAAVTHTELLAAGATPVEKPVRMYRGHPIL